MNILNLTKGIEFTSAFVNFYLRAGVIIVPEGDVWFVGVNNTLAGVSLTVNGYLRNEGTVTIRDDVCVDGGELDNAGEVIVGWN